MEVFTELFKSYGFIAILIILVMLLTSLIKNKFLKKAIEKAEAKGYDKTLVTKNVMYIPYVLAFLIYFIYYLITIKFNFELFNIKDVIDNTIIIALAAIALYEQIKLQIEAHRLKKEVDATKDGN